MMDNAASEKGRRVTIDLTPAAAKELDRLKAITGQSTANTFRYALTLLRDIVDGARAGREIRLVDSATKVVERIKLPFIIDLEK